MVINYKWINFPIELLMQNLNIHVHVIKFNSTCIKLINQILIGLNVEVPTVECFAIEAGNKTPLLK